MKVLVTGSNGFLGSWLTRALVDQGHEVFALVRPSSDLSELEGVGCEYRYGDVTDLPSLLNATSGIDYIFHLAGLIAYKKSEYAAMEKVNVQGTANVVAVCRERKIKRLVYLSSVVAIGAGFTTNEILNEDSKYNIADLNLGYFETKRRAEEIVKASCANGEIDAVILNPSTIYGPGDAKKGSRSMQVKVAKGQFPFYSNGGVSVVAVEDVIAGILSAWKRGQTGERYILSGENVLIKDLFAMIADEAGVPRPTKALPNWLLHALGAVGDGLELISLKGPLSRENAQTSTMYHWFDASKAKRELDFNPRPARQAIHNSVQWMKDKGLLKK